MSSMGYIPGDANHPSRWSSDNPDMDDLSDMIMDAGVHQWYNFVVTGNPGTVSPEWIAKHPGYDGTNYEYAVSYSVWHQDLDWITEESDDPVEAFNAYLEGTGKEWLRIDRIELVDRGEKWDNA